MAKRAAMTPEEIEAYLASAEEFDDMGPGYRTPEELERCQDGDGKTEQVKAE